MFNTTPDTLVKLALFVWLSGVVILIAKSCTSLAEAYKNGADSILILVSFTFGIVVGKVKAKYLFIKVGVKNIERINSLKNPKIWQFYRKRFFIFLFFMISTGKYLAVISQGLNMALILLAVLELSVGFALLFSSHCYRGHMFKS